MANAEKGGLPKGIEVAEVQWSVCAKSQPGLLRLIHDTKHVEEDSWATTLYDTEELDLFYQYKMVLRERAGQSGYKTAIKINLTYEEYKSLRKQDKLHDFSCELDTYLNSKGEERSKIGCKVSHSSEYAKDKFSNKQKELLKNLSGISFFSLRKFGKVETYLYKLSLFNSFHDSVKIEAMEIAGSTWVEVSTRADVDDIQRVNEKMQKWFRENNISLCEPKQSKTEALLLKYK